MKRTRFIAALGIAATIAASGGGAGVQAAEPRVVTLAEAIRLAVEGAAPARLAEAAADHADAQARERRAPLLPQLTGTASQANRTTNLRAMGIEIPGGDNLVGPFDTFDARLRVSQALFDRAGWKRWKAAESERDAFRADRASVEEEAASAAASAVLLLARETARVAARQADLALAEELLQLAVTRRDAGSTADIDVTRARTQAAAARSALVSAEHEEMLARVGLCRALGIDPGAPIELAESLDDSFARIGSSPSLEGAVQRALEERDDLAATEVRRRAAAQRLSAARGEWIPRVELVADAGWSGERPSDAETTRQIALQLNWNLIDGLGREARVAQAHSEVRANDIQREDLAAAVSADVRRAWSAIDAGRTLEEVAAQREALALEEVGQARLRLQEGMAGNLDLIEAQSTLVEARDAVIDARVRSALARIELARALGEATLVQ